MGEAERDAILERIVDKCLWSVYYNSGQTRESIESIIVHQSIANMFTNMFTEKVNEIFHLENPKLESCNYGCVNNPLDIGFFDEIVNDAQKMGGLVTIGGFQNQDYEGFGRFYEPTVIANVNQGMKCQI